MQDRESEAKNWYSKEKVTSIYLLPTRQDELTTEESSSQMHWRMVQRRDTSVAPEVIIKLDKGSE